MAVNNLKIASKAFQQADTYHKKRERFSLQSARIVLTKLGIIDENGNAKHREPVTVLELAAGTGKFTEVLVRALGDTNIKLISSEPLETMGRVFQENFPDVQFICCRSERILLPDASVHAVLAGNASHFLSTPESYAEIARVLVPGGGVGFVNLLMDTEINPWCLEFYKLSEFYYQRTGLKIQLNELGEDIGWHEELKRSGKFGEIHKDRTDRFIEATTEEDTFDCLMAYGSFATCESSEHVKIRQQVRETLQRNYSGAGKTMTELPMRSIIFHAMKK